MAEQQFVISELAKRSGYTPGMIRYFERAGVISPSLRTPAGYRLFGVDHIEELQFVRAMQDLGFHAQQIKILIQIKSSDLALPEKRETISKVFEDHVKYVEKKVTFFQHLQQRLQEVSGNFVDLVLEIDS